MDDEDEDDDEVQERPVQSTKCTKYLLVGTSPLTEKGAARYSLVVALPTSRGRFRLARDLCLLA